MASGIGKHKIVNVGPTEPWSIREKLCLASSVLRSGDQNWVSVSRAIKPFSESGRPPDWFSQKHCASQYSELLEATEAPKRKRGEKGEVVETIEDVIVRRLTTERIEELKKLLRDTQEQYRKLKKDVDLIQAGHMDSQLKELLTEITLKKKRDEEEAEQKRKATETAYLARQAIKNTPKRMPSVTVRSPLGASPSSLDPPAESAAQGVGVFLPADPVGPKEAALAALMDDSPQKRLLAQKATPPPSPLLSELLKKNNLISASPRLVSEGDASGNLSNGVQTATATALPAAHDIITGNSTPHKRQTVAHCSSASSKMKCLVVYKLGVNSVWFCTNRCEVPLKAGCFVADAEVKAELEEDTGLVEEDLVAVPYMGDELDLETVGDIIAIIEEKVDDSVEALDAAAVEAALSLCEEAHALPGPWDPHPPDHSPVPVQDPPRQDPQDGATMTAPNPQTTSATNTADAALPPETKTEGDCEGAEATGSEVTPEETGSEVTEEGGVSGKEVTEATVKSEAEEWSQAEANPPCLESYPLLSRLSPQGVKEEEACSEADADDGSELKEDPADGSYLSEAEPAASESEDGYGPPSQRYTADSLASSPASSSQLSTCGEDQEAVQAQKIWKKAIMLVWRAAANHRYASVFLQPVSDDIAPGYHSIVHRPMDLSAIKKNIESGVIRTTAEFQRDIMLMFQNAVMYNSSDHDVFHMALEMQRDVLEHVQQFLATQLIMQTSENAISAKSLRGREGARKPGEPAEKTPILLDASLNTAFLLIRIICAVSLLQDGGTRGRRSAMEADMKMKK
uniref:Bromodomain-containing protein 8 n=1 Tax=Neogobius melanostomus TaxID=47308 RepID=A0A8C6S749_9GOBI